MGIEPSLPLLLAERGVSHPAVTARAVGLVEQRTVRSGLATEPAGHADDLFCSRRGDRAKEVGTRKHAATGSIGVGEGMVSPLVPKGADVVNLDVVVVSERPDEVRQPSVEEDADEVLRILRSDGSRAIGRPGAQQVLHPRCEFICEDPQGDVDFTEEVAAESAVIGLSQGSEAGGGSSCPEDR